MRCSDLIERLEELKLHYGDLECSMAAFSENDEISDALWLIDGVRYNNTYSCHNFEVY